MQISFKVRRITQEKSEVVFLHRHVSPFLRIALTMYIFPTLLSPNFKFFLKSRILK